MAGEGPSEGTVSRREIFRGVTLLALDAKGRLAIPARHRDALSPPVADGAKPAKIILTVDPSRCALIYPEAEWVPIQSRLMGLSSFKPEIRALQRLIVGHADDAELDAAGRILVPPSLREFAGLSHHVALVGQGNRFELWDDARWKAESAQATTLSLESPIAELEGFSL